MHEAKILIVGAGGPGAAVAAHLAAAGAGYIAIADGGSDDGFNRAEILAARLSLLQPDLHADPYPVDVDDANSVAIAAGHDAIVDASGDTVAGRLLARAGAELAVPVVHIEGGAVLVTRPGETACFGCAEETGDGRLETGDVAPVERSLLAGLMGAVAAVGLAVVLREPPSEAVLRTARVPPEIVTRVVARDPSCAVCAAVPEGAR